MGNIFNLTNLKVAIRNTISIFSKKIDNKITNLKFISQIKKKYLLGGILLTLILTIIFLSSLANTRTDIPVYKVHKKNFLITITESGELRAKSSISIISPRIRGNLKIVYLISEGTYVKPNDIVCKFDPSEVLANLRDAETNLEIAVSNKEKLVANQKAQIAQSESQLKIAELSFELSKLKLDQVKFEAQAVQEQAKLEHEKNKLSLEQTKQEMESKKVILKSEMAMQEIEIKQRQYDLEKIRNDLQSLTVKAPTEGLVVYSINYANEGRKFAIGDTPWSGAEIITLPDLSAMESKLFVNEVDISKVKAGQKAIVKLDAFQDSSFAGEISSVASIGKNKDPNSNIKVFEVLVAIKARSNILKPGMTTSNKIIINEVPNVFYIPQEAVFEKYKKNIVYLKKGSSYYEKEVELGERGEDYIVVKMGLKEEDEIALIDPTTELKNKSFDSKKK